MTSSLSDMTLSEQMYVMCKVELIKVANNSSGPV